MKKIAFVEMETHSALLEQWYLLVKEMTTIDFHFFVSAKVGKKLSAIPEKYITQINKISDVSFLDFNGIVINTLHRNFQEYKNLFKSKPVLCLVHNLNFSLFLKSICLANVFSEKQRFTYFLKLYLKEKIASQRKVLHEAKAFGVISASALQSIKEDGRFGGKSQLIQMNYCRNFDFTVSDDIQIVMPGNVSRKRKDIDLIFRIIEKLKPTSKLHFVFLGKPENEKVLNQLEALKLKCNSNISITYYHRFIPWEEYSSVIAKSHLLLCPVKNKTSFYWVDEVYGKTKVSGAEADCIYNGKIGIFPSSYPKMDWYNWSYDNESDLLQILQNLTSEDLKKEYEKLQPFVERYTFEKVKNELEKQLLNL